MSLLVVQALGQTSDVARPRVRSRTGVAHKAAGDKSPAPEKKSLHKPRQVRAVLAPSDFPISLTAFDSIKKTEDGSGTVLEIAKNGYKTFKPEALFTKDLDGEQISSVVSWQNPTRTHFGFLVLTTPSAGNLYSVMFFLYHDGKLTMPIDEIATGYPVFPTVRRTEKSGQIQIEFYDGNTASTNDKVKTLVIYTWSDWSKKFLKNMHRVAGESTSAVERGRKVEKTAAARDGN
jgi:hypothetical protein